MMKLSMVQSAIGFYIVGFLGQVLPRRQPTMIPGFLLLRVLCLLPFSSKLELAATCLQLLGLYILVVHTLLWAGTVSSVSARVLDFIGFGFLFVTIIADLVIGEKKRRN